jgi:hypothetical protein
MANSKDWLVRRRAQDSTDSDCEGGNPLLKLMAKPKTNVERKKCSGASDILELMGLNKKPKKRRRR